MIVLDIDLNTKTGYYINHLINNYTCYSLDDLADSCSLRFLLFVAIFVIFGVICGGAVAIICFSIFPLVLIPTTVPLIVVDDFPPYMSAMGILLNLGAIGVCAKVLIQAGIEYMGNINWKKFKRPKKENPPVVPSVKQNPLMLLYRSWKEKYCMPLNIIHKK